MENTEPKKSNPIYSIIVLVAVLAVGYYIYSNYSKSNPSTVTENNSNNTVATSTSNNTNISQILNVGTEELTGEQIKAIPIPSLVRQISFPAGMAEDAKAIYRTKIENLESLLKKDSNSFQNWIDLGVFRKGIEDYEGAREVWEYASKRWPGNSISFGNLGDLYAFYLKDYKKAENSFLQSIKNTPDRERAYLQLADFYLNVVKDTAKAESILEEGIREAGTNENLRQMLDIIGK
ncbi:MAG: tetratricopeptide repeat protein [Candidatus Paceibacterota bacterium]